MEPGREKADEGKYVRILSCGLAFRQMPCIEDRAGYEEEEKFRDEGKIILYFTDITKQKKKEQGLNIPLNST